jgi:hypothetical protein
MKAQPSQFGAISAYDIIEVILLHCIKAQLSIQDTELPIITDFKELHPQKAPNSMAITELGMAIEVKS